MEPVRRRVRDRQPEEGREEVIMEDESDSEVRSERYYRTLGSTHKFSEAIKALEENYHPSTITQRDPEQAHIREYLHSSLLTRGSSESLCSCG